MKVMVAVQVPVVPVVLHVINNLGDFNKSPKFISTFKSFGGMIC
jgi:hypothetical protein